MRDLTILDLDSGIQLSGLGKKSHRNDAVLALFFAVLILETFQRYLFLIGLIRVRLLAKMNSATYASSMVHCAGATGHFSQRGVSFEGVTLSSKTM